jgi:hypothetical protein
LSKFAPFSKEIIVIIGGPNKSKHYRFGLLAKGFCCYPEISRGNPGKKQGIEQLFLENVTLLN